MFCYRTCSAGGRRHVLLKRMTMASQPTTVLPHRLVFICIAKPRHVVAVVAGCVLEVGCDLATLSRKKSSVRYLHRCCSRCAAAAAPPTDLYSISPPPQALVAAYHVLCTIGFIVHRTYYSTYYSTPFVYYVYYVLSRV